MLNVILMIDCWLLSTYFYCMSFNLLLLTLVIVNLFWFWDPM